MFTNYAEPACIHTLNSSLNWHKGLKKLLGSLEGQDSNLQKSSKNEPILLQFQLSGITYIISQKRSTSKRLKSWRLARRCWTTVITTTLLITLQTEDSFCKLTYYSLVLVATLTRVPEDYKNILMKSAYSIFTIERVKTKIFNLGKCITEKTQNRHCALY